MYKLSKAKTMYNVRLTNEKIEDIREMADKMDVYQEDLINDATRLYFNLYDLWEDDHKPHVDFEQFLEDLF